jgi:hypothetical protein
MSVDLCNWQLPKNFTDRVNYLACDLLGYFDSGVMKYRQERPEKHDCFPLHFMAEPKRLSESLRELEGVAASLPGSPLYLAPFFEA